METTLPRLIALPRGPWEKGEFKGILEAKERLEFIRMTVPCSWRAIRFS